MRLHTDTLTYEQILEALAAQKAAGRIAPTVQFKACHPHRSNSRARAFEIQLESWDRVPGDGRRVGNSGAYGAMREGDYAATYDEWGWLMAALYELDPAAVWGSVKHPQYADRAHFDRRTGLTYNPGELLPQLSAGTDPFPIVAGRSMVGRRGANRFPAGHPYGDYKPRTAAEYRAFARV